MAGIIIPNGFLLGSIAQDQAPEIFAYPTSGLVARWEGGEGLTLDGTSILIWTDQVGSLALEAVGGEENIPTVSPALSGVDAVRVGNSSGMQEIGVGSLPTGSAARTVAICWRPEVGDGAFGGFAYGTGTTDDAFGIIANTSNGIQADFFASSLAGPAVNGDWFVLIATYDGTTARFYSDNVLVDSVAKALTTGTTSVQLCLSFSGNTTVATVGGIFVYDRVLDSTERGALNDYLDGKYIADEAAPVFVGTTLENPTPVTIDLSLTSDESATVQAVLTTSATVPSDAQILAGNDHTGSAAADALVDGNVGLSEFVHTFTGLTAGTTYYAHGYADDGSGNRLNFSTASGATSAADTTAPTLSLGTAAKSGSSGYIGGVTTAGDANGRLYFVGTTRNTAPSAAQVKAGQNDLGASSPSGSQVITSTGAKTFSGGGLTADTLNYLYAMHEDVSGNQSTVASLGSFTTDAAVTGSFPAADVTVSSLAAMNSQLATWDGQTLTEDKYLDIQAGSYGKIDLAGYDFSPQRVYIRGASKTTQNVTITGVEFDDCKNITVQFFKTDRTGAGPGGYIVYFNNLSSRCEVEYCDIQGDSTATPSVADKSKYCIRETNACSFNAVRHCLIRHHVVGLYTQGDNLAFEFNQFHGINSDDVKFGDGFGLTFNRNWFSANKGPNLTGINDHIDWLQGLGNAGHTDLTCVGNVGIKGPLTTGAISGKALQGLFVDDGQMTRVSMTQNIMVTNNGGVKFGSDVAAAGGSSNIVSRNTCIFPADDTTNGYTCTANVAFGTGDYNLTVIATGGSILGANSYGIEVGTSTANADYSEYVDWLTGGVVNNGATIGEIVPVVGSGAHWNDTDPVGAAERFREIVVDGLHPGNSPNATLAAVWQSTYNSDGAITS